MQIQPRRTEFDVVIVGSGASGGWAAKRLTEAGLRVAVLEAGRQLTDADYKEHVPAFGLPYRGRSKRPLERERPVQSGSYAVREWNADWFVNDIDEPYVDSSDPAFLWVRPRLVGGRTNVWGRVCLRLSDIDFKAASHDGAGVDWPIGYADIAPYYDLVEDYVGINGMAEGLAELPDGRFQPSMPFTCAETALRTRFKARFGRTLTQGRSANLTRPTNGRQSCHYCGPCEHGCVTHSYFNASFTTMADAVATGRCTLITGAMAYKVLVDPATHRARGILYIDRTTREPQEIARPCRGALRADPGVGADPVQLGHRPGCQRSGQLQRPARQGPDDALLRRRRDRRAARICGEAGAGRAAAAVLAAAGPVPQPAGRSEANKDFLRGYGYGAYLGGGANLGAPGYGDAFKRAVAEPRPSQVTMQGFGECLRYEDNYCDVDPNVVDAWGIPVARIHLTPRANERAMQADMAVAAAEMLEAAGARNVRQWNGMRGQAHELGAAGWAPIRRRRCSIPSCRHTTSGTSS